MQAQEQVNPKELVSSIAVGILGAGLALLLYGHIRWSALPLLALGLLVLGWAFFREDSSRKANAVRIFIKKDK